MSIGPDIKATLGFGGSVEDMVVGCWVDGVEIGVQSVRGLIPHHESCC